MRSRSATWPRSGRNLAVSFDLAVLSATRPLTADEACNAYQRLLSGEVWSAVLPPDDGIAQFVAALSARWPDIDTLPESQLDASPWSNGLDVSPAHVLLNMRWSSPDAVIQFCEETAARLGLNLFDPQDGTLYAAGKRPAKAKPLAQTKLICEACGKLIEPGTPYAESPRLMHMTCFFTKGFP
jgi:hypothetical protein